MNKLLLSLLCLSAVFVVVATCAAYDSGVLAEERVIDLPQDAGKWHVSVVGATSDKQYIEINNWFLSHSGLRKLRDQVHFHQVATSTPTYKERYAPNLKGLPAVRVQKADGTIVYEAAGKNLPVTSNGLYSAIAGSVNNAQSALPILPWRRQMEKKCCPPKPEPKPEVPEPETDPQPIDNGGAPVIDEPGGGVPAGVIVLAAVACVIVGAGAGLIAQWKNTYFAAK